MTSLPHLSPGSSPAHRSLGEGGPARSGVVVDWSDTAASIDGIQASAEELIAWLSNCPRPSGIRVYLPPVRQRAVMQRLRNSLLALGVTVTCRMSPA